MWSFNYCKIIFYHFIIFNLAIHESQSCITSIRNGIERILPNPFGATKRSQSHDIIQSRSTVTRINSPGQRFTATHGINANAGDKKLFLFVVDRDDVNYMAVSSNIAIEGTKGGPERYELFMKYGQPPSTKNYDQKSVLTASDSYVGDVLYSRDITVPRPKMGEYYFMLVAYKDFHELLVTAIMDTPPDERKASFTIRRMGEWA